MLLAALTVFLSAFLLFQVQPMIARMILPWFGGTAAVWSTCMVFFQAILLLGYLYAHGLISKLTTQRQRLVHLALLVGAAAMLPILPAASWKPATPDHPVQGILLLLTATIGLPYFALSATGPLLQAWFVQARPGVVPYRLYALSNLGSMLALLSYPFLVEPALSLRSQSLVWSFGFVVFAGLCAGVGLRSQRLAARRNATTRIEEAAPPPSRLDYLLWGCLAFCPSLLLLSFTNFVTKDVASIPFLWVLPLTLYLVTLILCFDAQGWYRVNPFRLAAVPALGITAWLAWSEAEGLPGMKVTVAILMTALFLLCMMCHGELARRKPHPRYLTAFFLMMAAGGAAGGVMAALLAPAVFNAGYELPFALGLTGLLLLVIVLRELEWQWLSWSGIAALTAFSLLAGFLVRVSMDMTKGSLVAMRNFYSDLRVKEYEEDTEDPERYRVLLHGVINHGEQFVRPELRRRLAHYYCPDTGVGRWMASRPPQPQRIGVLGLGAGAMAAFGRPGDTIRYYEINPQVVAVAHRWFTYLKDTPATVEILEGDGRLVLEREPPQAFDFLLMDAFSGDSIPVHLLTVEALRMYLGHLNGSGVLVVHITNQHVDLAPVLAAAARELGLHARLFETVENGSNHCYRTRFVLMTRNPAVFDRPALQGAGRPLPVRDGLPLWTDDYSNLIRVLK